jgi:hypothetical protein
MGKITIKTEDLKAEINADNVKAVDVFIAIRALIGILEQKFGMDRDQTQNAIFADLEEEGTLCED